VSSNPADVERTERDVAAGGVEGAGGGGESFLELLAVHARLFGLFLDHQEALLARDFPLALERLRLVRREFEEHVRAEEELFAELFAHTDEVRGTPLDLFTGEHKHLRELLSSFEAATRRLDAAAPGVARRVIDLLDEEALFKTFFRHHDERERNLLYPAFDRGTAPSERRARLQRFHQGLPPARP
jgi:hemerythrin-like domain-containing protein